MLEATTALYGAAELANGMRAVRANTILIAQDIPESQYGFRATPATRSVAETLVHIAWLATSDRMIHEVHRIHTVAGFDFAALMASSAVEERVARGKSEIVQLLRSTGEEHARWIESRPDAFLAEEVAFPGGAPVTRFAWLLATKEHELQHRAQLTVLERLLGLEPRFTGLS
jgi:uncharacterized damage-inducible protein DinB